MFSDFAGIKTRPTQYLSPKDQIAYTNGRRLQRLILDSIERGESEINWDWKSDNFSDHDKERFLEFFDIKVCREMKAAMDGKCLKTP